MRTSQLALTSFSPALVLALALAACSSSSSGTTPPADGGKPATDSGKPATDSGSGTKDGAATDTGATKGDAAVTLTTIAAARQAYNTSKTDTMISFKGVVTGIQGTAGDQVVWYVEDPAGGPYSGVSVYCDPLAATTCPCMKGCANQVSPPPINTLVEMTATITSYHSQVQINPISQTIIKMGSTPPPVYTASATDLAEGGDSPYRGVLVKFPSTVTVDSTTPAALYNSTCNTGTAADAGPDAALPLCAKNCAPPTYSGFEVNGPGANAFFVEELFFPFVTLQSSPECLTQPMAVPVMDGQTFPSMTGILDYDGFASAQFLAPVGPTDY